MRATLGAGAAAVLLIFAAQAQSGAEPSAAPAPAGLGAEVGWGEAARALSAGAPPRATPPAAPSAEADSAPASEAFDVVDAHWMALTMWGEARGDGELAMRAVGHVIDNRRRSGRHGAYATDTVSEAWQFSCWNEGDPNLAAIRNIDRLRPGSEEQRRWAAAQRLAAEILAGRSEDPTGGALFYHTEAVAPAWSRGIAPIARIGDHLFFREARGA